MQAGDNRTPWQSSDFRDAKSEVAGLPQSLEAPSQRRGLWVQARSFRLERGSRIAVVSLTQRHCRCPRGLAGLYTHTAR